MQLSYHLKKSRQSHMIIDVDDGRFVEDWAHVTAVLREKVSDETIFRIR